MNARDRPSKERGIPRANRKPSWSLCCRLADNVRRYRLMRGYTQHELSRQCGFAKSYVGDVEQGTINITLANLEALAAGLRCGEEELLMRNH
jgi:transcriptional regulator with XRE-family HTH domain